MHRNTLNEALIRTLVDKTTLAATAEVAGQQKEDIIIVRARHRTGKVEGTGDQVAGWGCGIAKTESTSVT